MYETEYNLIKVSYLNTPSLSIELFEMIGRFNDLEHDGHYLAKVLKDNKLNEFTNTDLEHLYCNLSDCGLPFFIIETLLADINKTLVMPFNKNNYNDFIDLFCEKDHRIDEYHELVWAYSIYKRLYNLNDPRSEFKDDFNPDKLELVIKWE